MKSRNRERREAEAHQARRVTTMVRAQPVVDSRIANLMVSLTNYSDGPITEIELVGRGRSDECKRREPILRAGESVEMDWQLAESISGEVGHLLPMWFEASALFTDTNGQRLAASQLGAADALAATCSVPASAPALVVQPAEARSTQLGDRSSQHCAQLGYRRAQVDHGGARLDRPPVAAVPPGCPCGHSWSGGRQRCPRGMWTTAGWVFRSARRRRPGPPPGIRGRRAAPGSAAMIAPYARRPGYSPESQPARAGQPRSRARMAARRWARVGTSPRRA